MKKRAALAMASLLLIALLLLQACDRSRLVTTVTSVIDGDSVTVKALNGTVRLIGIDAPETRSGSKPAGQFADEAKDYLEMITRESGKVTLELHGKDTYGRHLAYLFDSEGTLINSDIVRQGLARPLTYEDTSHYSSEIRNAYREAFRSRRGIFTFYDQSPVFDASIVRGNLYSYQSGGFLGRVIWVEFEVTSVNGLTLVGDDIVVRIRSEEASLFVLDQADLQVLYRKRIRVYGEVWQDTSGKALMLIRDPGIEIIGVAQLAKTLPLLALGAF